MTVVAAMIVAALAACGDPAARVTLVPLGGECAKPAKANGVRITAYAASGEHSRSITLDETVAIADFPADTLQIGIEVIVEAGETGAAGKSAPLVFDALADRATIPVMMAPPDGFCELPAMTEPRAHPLVAPAGDGALVVGGVGPNGPLSTAEYYDRATATFSPVDVPASLVDDQGFTGAALAALPDGRIALIGGPKPTFIVFDPAARGFVTDPATIESWAFHAAIAVDQDVLVAGGCTKETQLACDGVPRLQTLRYQLSRLRSPEFSVILADKQIGAQLFDLGIQLDGKRRYLLAGGSGGTGRAERFALDDITAQGVPGARGQAALLDGGAVLSAFADDAAPSSDGKAFVFALDAAAAAQVGDATGLPGVRLIALENGQVAAFGGDAKGRVQIYDPTHDAWTTGDAELPAHTGALRSPSLVRLADGAVLVLGGELSPRAWLYRPPLLGPASGSVTVVPTSDVAPGVLTAPDPATVTRMPSAARWVLTTPDTAAMARALVGGPRLAAGSVSAIVHVVAGGVALIAQQTGPGQAIVAELAPGSPARLVRLDGGVRRVVCSGQPVLAAFDPAAPVTLRLALSDRDAHLTVDGRDLLVCELAATDRGAWGIASLGPHAQLAVDSVTVAR